MFPFGKQAHAECDVGKERSVVQQSRIPVQPLYGDHCFGPGETMGQGTEETRAESQQRTKKLTVSLRENIHSMVVLFLASVSKSKWDTTAFHRSEENHEQ